MTNDNGDCSTCGVMRYSVTSLYVMRYSMTSLYVMRYSVASLLMVTACAVRYSVH